MTSLEKYEIIIKHMRLVDQNCCTIAKKLLPTRQSFALKLIEQGRMHDQSKLWDFEFTHLWKGAPEFKEALRQHRYQNPHHPEFWSNNIRKMPEIFIAEMVCDLAARSQEFGTDLREYIFGPFAVKHSFTREDKIGKDIEYIVDLLLTPAF